MKTMIASVAIVLLLSGSATSAQEADQRALAEELLTAMRISETIESSLAILKQSIPAQSASMLEAMGATMTPAHSVEFTEKVMNIVLEELNWAKMKPKYIDLYAQTFTEEELKNATAYYRSPAGQAFTKKQPELMKRAMEINQEANVAVGRKIQVLTQEYVEKLKAGTDQQK